MAGMKLFDEILKGNPYHDERGRFATAPGGGGMGAAVGRNGVTTKEQDAAYMAAIEAGDMETAQQMVLEAAKAAGANTFANPDTTAYSIRRGPDPQTTVTAYKTFFVDDQGNPSALFVEGTERLPVGVWLDAKDAYHFQADNGKMYTPSRKNPNSGGSGKTGASIKIPNDQVRQELIDQGFLPEGSKAKDVVALAYRPGWHAGDLPFFPQGGKQGNPEYTESGKPNKRYDPSKPATNYQNVHRWNQVVYECEMAADIDYTKSTSIKSGANKGKIKYTDMQEMPTDGYYKFATNPMTSTNDLGNWYISGSLKIKRALTQQECDDILGKHGFKPQEWEGGKLDLDKLGYNPNKTDRGTKLLDPVTYDDKGKVIPLSHRFDSSSDDVRKSGNDKSALFIGLQIANAESLAIEGGESHEDFHVTLAYGYFDQGGHDEDSVDVMVQGAIKDIRDLIPDKVRFDAMGRFEASESSDGKDVIYARVAAGQLEKAHDSLLKALEKRGIQLEVTFPEYKPHMTLAYIEPGEDFELSDIDSSGDAVKVMIGHGRESSKENNYTIMKTDSDKRLVFGWASISMTVDGEQLEDRQNDMIDPEDLEEAVYEYVLHFRDTGEEHIPSMRKKGKLVESCVLTEEKQRAMGIPAGIVPVGWWIGFYIEDDDAWERVKNGTYKMFSIEGKASRVPVAKSGDLDHIIEVEKFNPYHDAKGRFATADGATSFTYKPGQGAMYDNAIRREKERQSAIDAEKKPANPYGDPDKIGGVERGQPMTRDQANQNRANPNYGKENGYSVNCQSCVVAFEARLRGYDVQTKSATNNSAAKHLSHYTDDAWIDPATGKPPVGTKNDINAVKTPKQVKQWIEETIQPGERYTFRHGWKGRTRYGHIISADRDADGGLRLYDPQTGKTYTGSDVDKYLSSTKAVSTIYGTKVPKMWLTRVDNMRINPKYADGIMEATT